MSWLRKPFSFNPVWWLNLAIGAAVLALFLAGFEDFSPLFKPHLPWWALAAAFLVAERCVVHLHFRRSAHSFSLGDLPLVFGLLFASPHDLIIGGLIGTATTMVLDRRLPPIKLVFNLAQLALAISVATIIVNAFVAVGDELGPLVWLATLVATEVSALVTVLLIGLAISLSEHRIPGKTLVQMLAMDSVVTVTNASLALAGAVLVANDARAIPLLLVPLATVFLAYRAYVLQQQRHEKLEFLYEATRTLSRAPEIVLALEGLLARTTEAFRAEMAEIVLFSSDTGPPLRTTLGPGDTKEIMQPMDPGVAEELRSLVRDEAPSVMLSAPFTSERLHRHLGDRRITDAMVAMLPGEDRIIGTIMLANRVGVVRSFTADDLKLFETLANNASVALQYDRMEQAVLQLRELQEQLHHQAFHDPLTDLGNRTLFINQVRDALGSGTNTLAVLFIDLDDFKTLNDSLGHAAGDEMLISVADRLRETVRPADAIARLGGDEFAVMVSDHRDATQFAIEIAERMLKAFEEPLPIGGRQFTVHLSVGIATTREARHADELIRNADLAMYRAKDRGKGRYELFHPRMRDEVLKRHGMKEELQKALEGGELEVEYQPIVALDSGEVVAAEALVRWNHPGRGMLLPSEFIPLAEETGQIVPIGQFVLEHACSEARSWRDANGIGRPKSIHVNLSAVELQHAGVLERVVGTIDQAGLNTRDVVLEITESVVQDDTSARTLRSLRDAGIRLALDDFGTGYSSLSYLRALPLDALKIAKPFVEGIAQDRRGNSFVRMIIELARALELQVIAEGIESASQLSVLRRLGCELGQGFYLTESFAPEQAPAGAPEPLSAAG
jgi:diguanylate cyclase (GGDEF)-like protein